MKQYYLLLLITSTLISSNLDAQVIDDYKFLDINNMKIPLFSRGDIFRPGLNNSHKAEMPKGGIANTIFSQNMWFGGRDQNNELHIAAQLFTQNNLGNVEYALGPVSNSNVQEFESKYNHVWKINKTDIENHIANYNNPTYTIPEDILSWPAHGDTEHEEAFNLAPFVDVNSNGLYEPTLGDYPKIRGDQALFAMFNDVNPDELNSDGQKVYIEVHVMLYGYTNPYTDFLENSYFVHYEIYNRSNNLTYPEFYIVHYTDFTLGHWQDDYVGTHVTKNIAYVYNGNPIDGGNGFQINTDATYGEKPPVFGWTLLNQNYHSTRHITYSNDLPKIGIPFTPLAKFYTMQGLFNDGTPIFHGEFGTNGSEITRFYYPGTSHPNFPTKWDAITDGSSPGNKHMTASTVSHNFGPGDKICLDYAGVFSRDYTSDTQHQLNHLFADVDGVQSIYNYENFECANHPLTIHETETKAIDLFATNTELTITRQKTYNKPIKLSIINAIGQDVSTIILPTHETEKTLDISGLPPGVYFISNHAFKFIKY